MPEVASDPVLRYQEGIAKIKEWLTKQPHLPHDIEDLVLARFLHSCDNSLQRTRAGLERFFTMRARTPELFSDRDPSSERVRRQLDITIFANTRCPETLKSFSFWKLNDPQLREYVFVDCMKAFFMQTDAWLMEERFLQQQDVVVMDCGGLPLKIIAAINVSTLRRSFTYLLEVFPTRLTQVHAINCPPFMDKLFALVKPVLPPDICRMIHFHPPGSETLYRHIPRVLVPVEFGGTGESGAAIMVFWRARMQQHRDFYLDEKRWISDEKRREKKQFADEADLMDGSFRNLCVD